jgi:hypothetical protein
LVRLTLIPEPSGLTLASLGSLALLPRRRFHRKNRSPPTRRECAMALHEPLVLDGRNIEELDASDTLDIGMTMGASTASDGATVSHGLGATPTG